MEQFHVRVSSNDLLFSAGHFITLEGDACEPLHGHDYRVAAEVHGPLDENQCVVDFLALHGALRTILDELDHRVLLPGRHPAIEVQSDAREVEVTFGERRWVFPDSDCVILPIANTTSELLAQYVGRRLLDELVSRTGVRPSKVRVELCEGGGFSAVCELRDE